MNTWFVKGTAGMIFLTCLLSGCVARNGAEETFDDAYAVDVKLSSIPSEASPLSDLFEGPARMIPLETTRKGLVGSVDKVLIMDSLWFILDTRVGRDVQIFTTLGHHIAQIRYIGSGPGEFDRPTDIALDRTQRQVHVYAQNSRKIIRYDTDGIFLSEVRLHAAPNDFAIQQRHYLFSMFNLPFTARGVQYNVHRLDYLLKEDDAHFPLNPKNRKYCDGPMFNLWEGAEGSLLYIPPHTYDIYRITPDRIQLAYRLQFGHAAIPESFFEEGYSEEDFFMARREKNYAFGVSNLMENGNYLMGTFSSGASLCYFMYSRQSQQTRIWRGFYVNADQPVGLLPYALNDRDEVLWFSDAGFFTYLPEEADDVSDAFRQICDHVDEEDNPVAVYYRIKPF